MYDIVIIGSGPAGLSAAVNAAARGKTAAIISNNRPDSGLYKAAKIDNYLGLPSLSGAQLSEKMAAHAADVGTTMLSGRVQTVMSTKTGFAVGYGQEIIEGKTLILALGVVQTALFPGERELLGRGVSYCATCDGMLFRGKTAVVVCLSPDAEEEAEFLASIGVNVIKTHTKKIKVNGTDRVTSVTADGEEIACDAVFILRPSIAPDTLLPSLETENGHIKVSRLMETNLPGVFAAGDCTGLPYYVGKAVGDGMLAVYSAVNYLATKEK